MTKRADRIRQDIVANPHPTQGVDHQHAVLTQIGLPYEPVDGPTWVRDLGRISVFIEAGRLYDRRTGIATPRPIPYGKNPRLVLMHLFNEALRTNRRDIDVGNGLRPFAASLGIQEDGRSLRELREQLLNLTAANITLTDGEWQINGNIMRGMRLLAEKRERWATTVLLDSAIFESIKTNAVQLDRRAIMVLMTSAVALDAYAWLAYRLRRVSAGQPEIAGWDVLRDQFGAGYARPRNFKPNFSAALAKVAEVYPAARFEITPDGVVLFSSPPPVMTPATVQVLLPDSGHAAPPTIQGSLFDSDTGLRWGIPKDA